MRTIKPFQNQGDYISMHHVLFDNVMPKVSGSAWKVLCLIIRKTVGWQKDVDVIAYSQIRSECGIRSKETISRALKELGEKKLIIIHRGERLPNGRMEPSAYSLNREFEVLSEPGSKIEPGFDFRTDNNHIHKKSSTSTTYSKDSTSTEKESKLEMLQNQDDWLRLMSPEEIDELLG